MVQVHYKYLKMDVNILSNVHDIQMGRNINCIDLILMIIAAKPINSCCKANTLHAIASTSLRNADNISIILHVHIWIQLCMGSGFYFSTKQRLQIYMINLE